MSRRPGIGINYLDTHREWHRLDRKNYVQMENTKTRLPRYYKEKIFNAHDRALLASEGVELGDSAYSEEVARLAKFHDDPYAYYDECAANEHKLVHSKINSQNLF